MSNLNSGTGWSDNTHSSVPANGVLTQDGEGDSLDTVFTALTSQCRRYIAYYLHQRGDIDVDELAELIAASENGGDRAAVTADKQEEVQIRLIHKHLPKLADAGIVEYDETKQRVHLGEEIPHLRPHLDEAASAELL